MLHFYAKQTPEGTFQQIQSPTIEGVWAHSEQPTDDELQKLVKSYDLDPNIVRDIRDANELPRVEYGKGNLYVFLRSSQRNSHGEVKSAPILSVLTDKAYITVSSTHAITLEEILQGIPLSGQSSGSTGLLVGTIVAVMSDYESLINRTGRYIQDIGHRLRNHEVNNSDFVHFVTVEDNLNEYTRDLSGMLAVVQRLHENRHERFSEMNLEELDDIVLHIQQLLTTVKSHAQSVTSIRNAYSTIANNTLNQRMKTLTVLTVMLTLPNVLFGMYGMNVPLPFQEEFWIYPLIVVFTASIILIAYAIAKRFRVF